MLPTYCTVHNVSLNFDGDPLQLLWIDLLSDGVLRTLPQVAVHQAHEILLQASYEVHCTWWQGR